MINRKVMKKILILLFISIAAAGQLFSQSLTRGEYYFDKDPGVGNGTVITPFTGGDDITENFNFSVSGLNPGFHNLFIRVRDDLGRWSLVRRHLFYVYDDTPVDLSIIQPDLVGFEYFYDKDKGVGTGIWEAATPSGELNEAVNFSTAGLNPGFHQLMVRARDADGRWGLTRRELFYVFDDTHIDLTKVKSSIVAAEYFFDKDTVSQGGGVPITITEGDTVEWEGGVLVEGLTAGEHTLFIRVKDADGMWSIVATKLFNVINIGSEINSPI